MGLSNNDVTHLARTNEPRSHHSKLKVFGIKDADRFGHIYIIGKTGTGKTTLLENIAVQDIANNRGLTLIDYHGDLVERIAAQVPERRKDDLCYLNVTEDTPYGYNPLKPVGESRIALAASGLLEVLHMQWGERAWGQRMEHLLRQSVHALLSQPEEMTFPDLLRLFRDDTFRKDIAKHITHKPVRDFWLYEYPKYSFRYKADAIAPIQSKVSAFLADPKLYAILTGNRKHLSFRRIMDEGKILLVNLSVGQLGTDSAGLLGGLLTTSIGLAALSRSDTPEYARRPHSFIADEFQHMTTQSFISLFPQLRKYRISMAIAHQYCHQIDENIRYAILGNVGTMIVFRVGAQDARFIAPEFQPVFSEQDLIRLPNHSIYLKLLINGAPSKPFSADTLPPKVQ